MKWSLLTTGGIGGNSLIGGVYSSKLSRSCMSRDRHIIHGFIINANDSHL